MNSSSWPSKKYVYSRSQLLSSIKMAHWFKEWTASILKEIYCLYENLMIQIDPLNNGFPQKLQYSGRKLMPNYTYSERAVLWIRQMFWKSLLRVQMSTIPLLKNLLYLITAISVVKLSNQHIHHERTGWLQVFSCNYSTFQTKITATSSVE